MKDLISYIHFIGFVPALFTYIEANPDKDITGLHVIMSALFSWGFVIAGFIERLT